MRLRIRSLSVAAAAANSFGGLNSIRLPPLLCRRPITVLWFRRALALIRTFEMRKPPNSQGHAVMDAPPLLLGASMLLLHYLPLLVGRQSRALAIA